MDIIWILCLTWVCKDTKQELLLWSEKHLWQILWHHQERMMANGTILWSQMNELLSMKSKHGSNANQNFLKEWAWCQRMGKTKISMLRKVDSRMEQAKRLMSHHKSLVKDKHRKHQRRQKTSTKLLKNVQIDKQPRQLLLHLILEYKRAKRVKVSFDSMERQKPNFHILLVNKHSEVFATKYKP